MGGGDEGNLGGGGDTGVRHVLDNRMRSQFENMD